jgi:hypothetical protein
VSGDLFGPGVGPAPSRRTDPDTSHKAGAAIGPAVLPIRDQVLRFAIQRAEFGFIDDELKTAFPDAPESSYRKRRSELSEERLLVDTTKRRRNSHGNEEIVWIHRQFASQPAPVQERQSPTQRDETKRQGQAMARDMRQWAKSMKKEGRAMFADGLERAAYLMELLSRA